MLRFKVVPGAASRTSVRRTLWCAQPVVRDGFAPDGCPTYIVGEENESARGLEKHARTEGWKKTDQHGWVCPACWIELDGLRDKSWGNGRAR